MKRIVYKVFVENKQFIRTINKNLAERTARCAAQDYGLKAEVVEAFEEYEEWNGEGI